jgi:hypothetical protein
MARQTSMRIAERKRQWTRFGMLTIAAMCAAGCCEPAASPEFLVPGQWPTREEFTAKLGPPRMREVTTIGALAARDDLTHWDVEGIDQPPGELRSRLTILPADQEVEWIVWEGRCLWRLTYRIAGAFELETGQLVEVDGDALLDDWYRTS